MATTTKTKIMTHLWYRTDVEEAVEFYCSIFPDSRIDRVTTLRNEGPGIPPHTVKVVDFTLFGQAFQAISGVPHHEFNDAISIVVQCDDQAELDRYWNAILENGGQPQACGWIIDRWGLRWQIVPAKLGDWLRDSDPARVARVSARLFEMVKIDVAGLEGAYRG